MGCFRGTSTILYCCVTFLAGRLVSGEERIWPRDYLSKQWDWQHTWSSVELNNQAVGTLLASVLGQHRFTLPLPSLERGIKYAGSATRLRNVLLKMFHQEGANVKVAVVGGSLSLGVGSSERGKTDWFSIFAKYLIAAFPKANTQARNGCVGGTTTSYTTLCLEHSVDPDVDLVLVEFTLNDGIDSSLLPNKPVVEQERLIRRILALPNRPAVLLVHAPTYGMGNYPEGHPHHVSPGRDPKRFHETSEDAQMALSEYYDVPTVSFRTALYDLAVHREVDGFRWDQIFEDAVHTNDAGHALMADLVIYLVQQTAIKMLFRPFSSEDAAAIAAPVPEPIYPGNMAPMHPACLLNDGFRAVVTLAEGFEWTVEGTPQRPKPGYIATQPGSRLQVKINTDRSYLKVSMAAVRVVFLHLKSYEHMGVASISCVSGCNCSGLVVDAHHTEHTSQLYNAAFEVSQSTECEIELKVLEQSTSGEHKFKLAGVVVAERPASDNAVEQMPNFHVDQHMGDDKHQPTFTRDGVTNADWI